jgi:putative oxidoreductase
MIILGIVLTLAIPVGLVLLFLPFSPLDKLLNFKGAVAQAREVAPSRMIAAGLIVAGLCVEVFMSLGVVTVIADRACAFVLAGYCSVTALLRKPFGKRGDFWTSNTGHGRTLFWIF